MGAGLPCSLLDEVAAGKEAARKNFDVGAHLDAIRCAEPLARIELGRELPGPALLFSEGRRVGEGQAAVLALERDRVGPARFGQLAHDSTVPGQADLGIHALQLVGPGGDLVLHVRPADRDMVPDLLANSAAAGRPLEGLDAGLIVDLDRDGMAGQKGRFHEGTAVDDAQDRTAEEDPAFLVLDGVVEPLLLRKPAQDQPGVLVADQHRDLLAALDQIAMTQEVERPAGRQDFVPHMSLARISSRT